MVTQDTAGSSTMLVVPEAAQVAGWRTQASEEHERTLPAGREELRGELAARILVLTGRRVSSEDAHADADGLMAVTSVDGTTFRLYRHGPLAMVRACVYCGTGHFESPQIRGVADLGYALGAWRPLHEECEDYEDLDASEHLADW